MWHSGRGSGASGKSYRFLAQAGPAPLITVITLLFVAFLSVSPVKSVAQEVTTNAPTDLAKVATSEGLPQVSAALLRTQIQQEVNPAKRSELTRRLVVLLVTGGRFEEAVAVSASGDASKDPALAYWEALALMGTGDYSSAKKLFLELLQSGSSIEGVSNDQVVLYLSRALRGGKDPEAALVVLDKIPADSPLAEDATLERCADLLTLGRTEECLKQLKSSSFSSDEGKAAAAYMRALTVWRSGDLPEAKKLFISVPKVSPWSTSASALGAALCFSSAAQYSQAIAVLEKRLNDVDEAPLLAEQFRLLYQLYASASTTNTTTLRKWAEDHSRPSRGKMAAFYLAKGEFRLGHAEVAESILDALIKNDPDDPFSDEARLMLASSRLRRGGASEVLVIAADRPMASASLRARLAYIRGLAAASAGRPEEANLAFQSAGELDPKLVQNSLFNQSVLIATRDKGSLDLSKAALGLVELNAGAPSEEMDFQIALDLARRGDPSGLPKLIGIAEKSSDPGVKSRARLAAAELNMQSGRGEAANRDLAKVVHEYAGEPEREEYLNVFLKDTGRKADSVAVITAARDFLKAHPGSRFEPEIRLKLAESLLTAGDIQGARIEFEQLAASSPGTDLGRRALFLAAQSAARAMDPTSIDDSLMLLERVASTGGNDQLVWQARLQEGALKNAQNLPLEALAIYDMILSSEGVQQGKGAQPANSIKPTVGPDRELRAAALMAKGDTLHQIGMKDPAKERDAVKTLQALAADPAMPLRWRNQALCKSGLILEKLGEGDAALTAYYEAFKNPRTDEPDQLWHDKAAFDAARLLESRKQWNDAVALYGQILTEGGPRADEAKARLSKLRLENFLWEN